MTPFMKAVPKLNDVFHTRWKVREWNDQIDHCFQGLFIVFESHGELIFGDTYWGLNVSSQNRTYTFEKADELFDLTYYCNLDEIEPMQDAPKYYADEDVFRLSEQHSCMPSCVKYFIRKGAARSKAKMLDIVAAQIVEKESSIKYANSDLIRLRETLEAIENGNLEVYL